AAVIDIVNHAMAEALKIVSVQRGHDPRDFVLAAFGGAGPLHAAALANELGIVGVICPPIPGAFSALGLVATDLKRDYVQTLFITADTADPATLEAAFLALENKGCAMLDRAGIAPERRRFERAIDARYERQSYELTIPVPPQPIDQTSLQKIAEAFHSRHLQTYGHDNRTEPVKIVNVRVAAIGMIPPLMIRDIAVDVGTEAIKSRRQLWFRETGEVDAPIYDRSRMPLGLKVAGPTVIESLESTILVPPRWQANVTDDGFVVMTRLPHG
ncbi:MAG TPA: hydantoinase/oxoprolinase family protein, partial [Pseudolabrys sp.]|nr:hydantoinase/oxoprolinase family protein [Pseudolabrys sp.]